MKARDHLVRVACLAVGGTVWYRVYDILNARAVAFAFYWAFPTVMVRQTYAGLLLADALMRGVVSLDRPANCFPSGHCMFATLGFLGVWRGSASRPVVWTAAVLAVLVCASTVLVGQHYWHDIPGGILTAVVAFLAVYPPTALTRSSSTLDPDTM